MGKFNPIEQILREYQSRLAEILGENLESVIVYGSQARRDAEQGSDIDVLCVMRTSFDYGDLLDRTSQATSEISLKYDVVLSRTFVTSEDYSSRNTPFLMNIRREGIAL
jgi:predicted nucleotidyltransferase